METPKPVHTLVLDAGAIIKNEPPVSTLLRESETLVTVPAIISEIKDAAARSRVETTLRPFLTLRTPTPSSVKFVTDFARRTGDLAVLSRPDIQIIALTYEIECERNGGDWRLRKAPGQKRVNGAPPSKPSAGESKDSTDATTSPEPIEESQKAQIDSSVQQSVDPITDNAQNAAQQVANVQEHQSEAVTAVAETPSTDSHEVSAEESLATQAADLKLDDTPVAAAEPKEAEASTAENQDSDCDSDGWITPSNLKKQQAKDAAASTVQTPEPKTMQVAVLTSDFAMQNVLLQINLNLLSPSLDRVKHLKTYVLRCHACFQVTKDMSKQFCPRCGQPSLTRVSCSTSANGEFKLHLKKNMQWNNRGDRYSIPKAVHGSANGKIKGGGKNGWGNELILAEDQKEYQRATIQEKKTKERNLMDEDYLPGILTGDRGKSGGRIKVGAGRSVNARKR